MEKPYKTDMECLISDIWVLSFFLDLTFQAVINDGISACNVRSLDVLLTMIMTLEGHCKNLASLLPSAQSEDIFFGLQLVSGSVAVPVLPAICRPTPPAGQ